MMESTQRTLARSSAFVLIAFGLLATSCRSVPWDSFLPTHTFALYAVARFKGTLLMGDYSDSYELLTKKTQEEIPYITWWVGTKFGKAKIGEHKLYDVIVGCEVRGEIIDERDRDTVYIVVEYKNWGGSIPVKRENGNWKVGLYEFVVAEGEELEP